MRLFLPLLALLFLVSGCSAPPTLPRPLRTKFYMKVVSLSPGITEIVLSTNSAMLLKGRTAADDWPGTAVKSVEIVASPKPDYELLKAREPDLILYDSDLEGPDDVAKLKALGCDLYAVDAKTVAGFYNNLVDIGSRLGCEMNVNDYIERIRAATSSAQAIPFSPAPKVAILMAGEGGPDYIAGTKSFLADVVKNSGGVLVGPDADKFVTASPESVLSYDPDLVIVPGSKTDMKGAEEIASNPKYQTLRAIKNHNIKAIDSEILLRKGQRVDQLIAALHAAMAESVKSK